MGKKKKKKDILESSEVDTLKDEYEKELALLRAKNQQLDGLIQEARLFVQEIKEIRDGIDQKLEMEINDDDEIVGE